MPLFTGNRFQKGCFCLDCIFQSCFRRLIIYFDLWLHGVSSVKNLQANVKFLGWMLFGKLFGDGNNFDTYNVWREKFVCIR